MMLVDADDDSLGPAALPQPRLTPTPPAMAMRLDAVAVALMGVIVLATLAGPSVPILKRSITLPSLPFLLTTAALVVLARHVAFRGTTSRDTFSVWRERLDRRRHAAAAFRAFVATRPAVFVVAHFAVVTFGLAPTASFTLSSDPFANLPARFDAGWYGAIAIDGYEWDRRFDRQRNIAFFPALPMLMRPVGQLIGSRAPGLPRERRMLRALWGAVFISLTAFFLALVYLSRLSRILAGADAAAAAPLLLAAYPFAAFFNAPYTEGLFLLGAVGAFYYFLRERWVASSLFGLLVGLSRPNGCFVSVPLAILAAQALLAARKREDGPAPLSSLVYPAAVRLLVAAMPGIGMLAFTAYLYAVTDVWFAWARVQGAWGRTWGIRPLAQGWEWLTTEGLMSVSRGVPFDTLNTLAVVFVVIMSWSVLRRLGVAYAAFVALNLVPPIFAGGALSMGRITSTLFPVFIALAAALPRQAVPAWAGAFALLQGLVAALFFTWRELF